MNGSSAVGRCSNVIESTTTCANPNSSVLFDRHIPTLTGLDGNTWASQLLTMEVAASPRVEITFGFHDTPTFTRVEVLMFNCPQWELGVERIIITDQGAIIAEAKPRPSTVSCDSLVRICLLPTNTPRNDTRVLILEFVISNNSRWVHLAEVTFWNNNLSCPPDIVVTKPPPLPATLPFTGSTTDTASTSTSDTVPTPKRDVTVTAISVLFILLLVLVGVMVVVLVLCRCRHQHTAKEEASHTSSQTQLGPHEKMRHTHEEHNLRSLHARVNDEGMSESSVNEPEYSVVATKFPSPDSHELESGTLPDHIYDQVDEKREKKAYTQQQAQSSKDEDHLYDEADKQKTLSDTGVVQFAKSRTEEKNRGHSHQKFSPLKTALPNSHDIHLDSELQERHLYTQIGTSAGEGEGQEYEQMDTGEGGVAVSDPTYMEVGAAEGKTFDLRQNEAYGAQTCQLTLF